MRFKNNLLGLYNAFSGFLTTPPRFFTVLLGLCNIYFKVAALFFGVCNLPVGVIQPQQIAY